MSIINVNPNKCMSRKNKKKGLMVQCPHEKKVADYCEKHSISKNILRIDNPLPKKYINKLMDIYTDKSKSKKIKVKDKKKICILDGKLVITTDESKFDKISSKTFETNYKSMEEFIGKNMNEILKMISGPAYEDPLLSHNNIDPISQEEIWEEVDGKRKASDEIDRMLLFSYKENNFIRCFNINSLKQLFQQNIYKHPVTGHNFPKESIDYAKIKIDILEDQGIIELEWEETELTNKKIKQYTFEVFYKFHKFNIYPKDEWFLNLSLLELGKMYYETKDFFVQNTTPEQKKILVPPDGISFEQEADYIKSLPDKLCVQYYILNSIEKIISLCSDESLQTMGTYIALGGLATVSLDARKNYPDIAYSFM